MSHIRLVLALVAGLVAACSPADRAPASPAVVVADAAADAAADAVADADAAPAKPPLAVDILWVIDNSPGGVYGQRQLAENAEAFLDRLGKDVDVRTAVVTIQQIPDVGSEAQVTKVGRFTTRFTKVYPPNFHQWVPRPCLTDQDCVTDTMWAFDLPAQKKSQSSLCPQNGGANFFPALPTGSGPGAWRCASAFKPEATANADCSVNTRCWYHCETAQECRDLFEPGVPTAEQTMQCHAPGGTSFEIAACQLPPPTAGCLPCRSADRLIVNGKAVCRPECFDQAKYLRPECRPPGVLQGSDLADLRCRLSYGASQTQESKFEGAFRSAWVALDPNGPNCPKDSEGRPTGDCQYAQLVRKDALLVLVFTSNNDDCSVSLDIPLAYGTLEEKKALKSMLPGEFWEKCQLYGDAAGGDLHLNEGNCLHRQGKDPSITCPADCRDRVPGSSERAACDAKAAAAMATSVKKDFRIAAVSDYVSKFKNLKADSAQVVAAVIVGDSFAVAPDTDHAQTNPRHLDRVAVEVASLSAGFGQTSICKSAGVYSAFGSRYIELAEAFGKGGFQANLCTPGGLGQVMLDLADHIRARAEALHAR